MANSPPTIDWISPPLVNSACPWATTLDDLRLLYNSPSTGAVTTRTSLISGFPHDPAKHHYVFYDPATHTTSPSADGDKTGLNGSLNSLGYSPLPLETYLDFIRTISSEQQQQRDSASSTKSGKGFIISVTGTPGVVAASYVLIATAQKDVTFPLAMEINLSCPNIPDRPPPAYAREGLAPYLAALRLVVGDVTREGGLPRVAYGLKTPPYTYATQFDELVAALEEDAAKQQAPHKEEGGEAKCQVSFLTATNTLGSCLAFASPEGNGFALPGTGIGGMAGAPLHALALGNVATLRRMLDAEEHRERLGHISVIGVGGVADAAGYRRMRAVGAGVVGVGTGLGLKGVGVFGKIENGVGGEW